MPSKEFNFSRLFLLIAGTIGVVAFFYPFYQVESFLLRTSGFDIVQEFFLILVGVSTDGLIFQLFEQPQATNPIYWLPSSLILFIPILFGCIGLELLIRTFWLRTRIVHRVWPIVILSLLGIGLCWWVSFQSSFEFYFVESVRRGYWWGVSMALFSLMAHFVEDF